MLKTLWPIALAFLSLNALQIGSPLPQLTLSDDEGGMLDNSAFNSNDLRGKVHVIFYVDPDEKDVNNPLSEALKAEKFDKEHVASVAIINMAATWLPNFAIASSLTSKQEQYPDTLYVKDFVKKGVGIWAIADDASVIIITDKARKVIYLHQGKVPDDAIASVVTLIKAQL